MRSMAAAALLCGCWQSFAAAQDSGHLNAERTVRAQRAAITIALDGRLDEDEWSKVSPATGFIQWDPHEGQPATQRTEVRFLFDDDALYIGARMYDTEGGSAVRSRLARRDQLQEGDYVEFIFDTFHDHTGRTVFTVSPSGARADAGQASSFADPSWDPVWEVVTQIDSLGWSAELRVPFSQLRYPLRPEQNWGLQVWRFTERLNELSMWAPWGKQDMGGPQRFGHLEGLTAPDRGFGLEVLPYVVSRAEHIQLPQPDTPLRDANAYGMRVGADLKALLNSTFTLDATVNPDFGQVEVDPAVVNLSAFETFFEEKRPFFVEGSGLFSFGGFNCYFCSNVSSMSLFYSRRIGRVPQGSVSDAKFVDAPNSSTILGAAKVTGRTENGYQIGLMNAVTASENARAIGMDDQPFNLEIEPLTNYTVGRVRRVMNGGNLTLGAIGTSVIRRFDNDALRAIMPAHAEAIGLDWNASWARQSYNFMGNFALTNVSGSPDAIHRLQRSSARYFQRPDRDPGENGWFTAAYDPAAESLRGFGGYARVAKVSGNWQWETSLNFRSPGFEANDAAFLTRADYIWMNANVFRTFTKPTSFYRELNFIVGGQQQFTFDGDLNDRQVQAWSRIQLPNWWSLSGFVIHKPEVFDERLTRGGPIVRRPAVNVYSTSVNSDSRKRLVFGFNTEFAHGYDQTDDAYVSANVRFKPSSTVSLSIGPSYSRGETSTQFVDSFADSSATHFHGRRVVFADLVQHSLSMDTRLSATFTPTLTLELFVQPFIATGNYSGFKEFTRVGGGETQQFDAQQLSAISRAGRDSAYVLDPDRNANTENFRFRNPDFNLQSLRGNAVLRWEYRPGSTLFLVWQQSRSSEDTSGRFRFSREADALLRGRPDNIFMVKMTYWLSN